MLEKITIIGTGLMGGSLSLALRQARAASVVAACDSDADTLLQAGKMGVADEVFEDAQAACRGAQVVFIATPISAIGEAVAACAGSLAPGTVVSDLASTKAGVVEEITAMLPDGVGYVGGHPMTGSEQSGVRFAVGDMFDMRYYILTPTDSTDPEDLARIHGLLTSIGARVITMDPESHDRAMATVSHVPHMLSLLLMELASREQERMQSTYKIAAGGFRDMTRIATSNPDMWMDIARENRSFIIERLEEYGQSLDWLLGVLRDEDDEALRTMFADARAAREELQAKSGIAPAELYSVSLPVRDEPGVISRITTAVGAIGINIEDISITHPLEGETGILALKVLGEKSAAGARDHLRTLGYRATSGKV